MLPQLEEALRHRWPFVPEELTVVDGAMDALDRIAQVVVRLGDRVIVEHPTFPPLLDLLEKIGADVIGMLKKKENDSETKQISDKKIGINIIYVYYVN